VVAAKAEVERETLLLLPLLPLLLLLLLPLRGQPRSRRW
jgi:hypothetical protein